MWAKKIFWFLNTIYRECDKKLLENIDFLYKESKISKLSRWHLIERLSQIPHIRIESKIPESGTILDVGTGRGGFAVYTALKSSKRNVYGIDTDIKRLNDAIKVSQKINNCSFYNSDLNQLVNQGKKFDVILSMDILHHNTFKEQEKLIGLFLKLLNKNGKLVLLEPGDYPLFRYFMIWLFDFILYFPFLVTCKYRTENQWKTLFEKIGFTLLESEHITDRGLFFTRKIMVFEKDISY